MQSDLASVRSLGYRLISLSAIVDSFLTDKLKRYQGERVLGMSFDDGPDYDWHDYEGDDLGFMPSFHTILKAHGEMAFEFNKPFSTSFVIASPKARQELDKSCIAGRNQWQDLWWRQCVETNIIEIGNHSWDHVHESLSSVALESQIKGSFFAVNNLENARLQIKQAHEYISRHLSGEYSHLFAYPYGHVSDYLRDEYFPNYQNEHWQRAAFTTESAPITFGANRWALPRFVCGQHWKSSEELVKLIQSL
ncbi:MAG: polysaccharide deacetylase family protein [Burkholderiales bacterium]|nr:polysaccharide deacetylase family protein [Burkholderiales bacterium]